MFSRQSVSENPLIATFELSPAASLNLGRSQNGVLGNGLSVKVSLRIVGNKVKRIWTPTTLSAEVTGNAE